MANRRLGKVFVTGADGFIGSHLTEALLERGNEVTALCVYNSLGTHGWLERLAANRPMALKLVLGDVRDPYFMDQAVKGHDTVFHLASLIAIPYSYVAPASYFETNVNGALHVAEACRRHGVGRLIHTSTSEVYGTALVAPISEDHPLQGQSPYSASKIAADKLVESYVRSFDLPAVTLRPFNTYGPRQSLRAVIPTIAAQLIAGSDRLVLGSTSPTRDFTFVKDTVAAFLAVGEHGTDADVVGRTFNAGSGREISIGDLAQLLAKIVGRKVEIASDEDRVRPKNSEVERLLADASRLQTTTGWRARTSLEDGLTSLVDWVRTSTHTQRAAEYVR